MSVATAHLSVVELQDATHLSGPHAPASAAHHSIADTLQPAAVYIDEARC